MEGARLLDMRTIPTIEMIPSFEKRVGERFSDPPSNLTDMGFLSVCVSSLMVDEIKRIIKTSEIMKYLP
jgi:hypothetical protein